MIAVLLAAMAGASYGAADFSGAAASKRADSMLVTLAMQAVSLVSLGVVLIAVRGGHAQAADLAWAALGGIAAAVALTFFYRALVIGPMSTAAALTGLIGAVVPVAVGVLSGDRLTATTRFGVILSIAAGFMVCARSIRIRGRHLTETARERVATARLVTPTERLSLIAGLGFGLFFVALSRVSPGSGLFPLVSARVASIAVLAGVLSARRAWEMVSRASWAPIVFAGVLDCAANACYLLAVRRGQLSWVAAITSLYPVATVVLARVALKERLERLQTAGVALSAAALFLVAWGR
jgi:uncharacterized membrane protein